MTIRAARTDDIDTMGALLAELFAIEDDFAIDPLKQREGLRLLLEEPETAVWVAETAGIVVGMITMQRLVSTAAGGYAGLIEDLIVARGHRGRRIGTLLLQSAVAEAEARGYARLALGVDVRNHPAAVFYEAYGFNGSSMGLMYLTP